MDWGFCGPAYTAADPDQDAQELINWYLEAAGTEFAKEKWALLGCPGRSQVASGVSGEVRGCWVLPGGTSSLWVIGSTVYLMTVATAATSTSVATLSMTNVGTISSSSGQVCIRDNNAGGIAVIVDGTSSGYVYNIAAKTVKTITDPAFYGSDRISFIDGWLVFNKPGTQVFYSSPLYWDGVKAFDATYFALKDSSSDNLVTHTDALRELWLIGERTTEVWYDAGNQYFPFSRVQGITLQIGCIAKNSLTKFNKGLVWLARSERGEALVVATEGYGYEVISNAAVARAMANYPVISDAIGYSYSEAGHTFYCITFPTMDVTWVYDAESKQWHKRASWDNVTGFHRDRTNCFTLFQDQLLVGDYANGTICRLTRDVFTENGNPLVSLRRTAHVWDGDQRERLFHSKLQIQFRTGSASQGTNPQCMVRWSNDSGQTWSNQLFLSMGVSGDTKYRVIARRLGASRDRIYEVSVSDAINRDIVGATLQVER